MFKILLKISVVISLVSCSTVDVMSWSFPYSPAVQQGNYIDSKMISSLHVGMTKHDVLIAMEGAEPVSQFVFDNNVWTYIYQVYKNDKLVENKMVTLEFKNDRVVKITKKLSVT